MSSRSIRRCNRNLACVYASQTSHIIAIVFKFQNDDMCGNKLCKLNDGNIRFHPCGSAVFFAWRHPLRRRLSPPTRFLLSPAIGAFMRTADAASVGVERRAASRRPTGEKKAWARADGRDTTRCHWANTRTTCKFPAWRAHLRTMVGTTTLSETWRTSRQERSCARLGPRRLLIAAWSKRPSTIRIR